MKSFFETSYCRRLLLTLALACLMPFAHRALAQVLPPGFSQVKLAALNTPMGLASAPDGRLFICEKGGDLKVFKNGSLLPTPAIHINVNGAGEGGLLAVTCDPDFATNQYIYVYYTANTPSRHNRLSRFTMNGDVVAAGSELVLLDLDMLTEAQHMGGGLAFGADGKIYLASGENRQGSRLQNLDNFFGKLLRINKDGSAPDDNPFASNPNPAAKYIWALGFRNPYTLATQLTTGKIFVNDIGSDPVIGYEEINNATTPGKNFGWPEVEGDANVPAYTNPYYKYNILRNNTSTDTTSGCAITGGAFFNPAVTNYPAAYYGKYFFVDFCNQWISYLDPTLANPTPSIKLFAKGIALNATNLIVGANGNFYYISNDGASNTVGLYTIVYSNNSAPTITSQPVSQTIPQNQSATFKVTAIGSPTLQYQWKKGGVSIAGATASTYTIASVAPGDAGQYTVQVTNSVGTVTSSSVTLTVSAPNTLPVPTITSPAAGTLYNYNDVISFSGTATDQEDGTLPASAFKWKIEFQHDQHFHPVTEVTGAMNGTFPVNISEPDVNVAYRISLTVTDSRGQSTTTYRNISPRLTSFTVNSNPAGIQLSVDGIPVSSGHTVSSVVGMPRTIAAPPQVFNGQNYEFSSWSNNGAQIQTITPTTTSTTYTANYVVGTNFALNKPVKASSVDGSSTANLAVDGNGATRWSSVHSDPQWISVDLGQTYTVKHIKIIWETAAGKDYKIQISPDESSWSDVKVVTGNGQLITDYPYLNATGRYIRVSGTARATPYGYSIYELQVFGTTGGGNQSPTASITSPSNNASFTAPASITINATAADTDGTISKVEFYNGTTKLGEDLSNPYSYVWTGVGAGTYTLTAKAIDNLNASGTSTAVSVTVTGGSANLALNKTATASSIENGGTPASGAVDGNTTTTRWASAATDPQWIYVDLGASYSVNRVKITWEGAYGKDYLIQVSNDINNWGTAVKTVSNNNTLVNDWTGLTGTGRYVRVYGTARGTGYGYSIYELEVYGTTGGGNQSPTASITSPSNNASFTAPASITINATAADADGTVSKVEFYNGTTKLGEDLSNPYSYVWTGVGAGTYTLTAKAIDNLNASGTSTAVSVTVTGGGSVNLALNKTAVASTLENGGTPASGAVDGNTTTTRWSSAAADPQWIYVDLGASYNVNRVKITWEGAYGKDYLIQVSNDINNWGTAVKTVSNNNTLVNDWTGLTGTGRYVRVYGTARGTGYGYSIYELEVYGTSAARFASLEDDQQSVNIVAAYPNPVSDYLSVALHTDKDDQITISLYDYTLNEVVKYAYTIKGDYTVTIPVFEFASGSYLLTITNGAGRKTTQRISIVK